MSLPLVNPLLLGLEFPVYRKPRELETPAPWRNKTRSGLSFRELQLGKLLAKDMI